MQPVRQPELVGVLADAEHLFLDEALVVLVPLGRLAPVGLEVVLPRTALGRGPLVDLDRLVKHAFVVRRGADHHHGGVGGRTHGADRLVDDPLVGVLAFIDQDQVVGAALDLGPGVCGLPPDERAAALQDHVTATPAPGHLVVDVGVGQELGGVLAGEPGHDPAEDDVGLVVGRPEHAHPQALGVLVEQVGEYLAEDWQHDHGRRDRVRHRFGLAGLPGKQRGDGRAVVDDQRFQQPPGERLLVAVQRVATQFINYQQEPVEDPVDGALGDLVEREVLGQPGGALLVGLLQQREDLVVNDDLVLDGCVGHCLKTSQIPGVRLSTRV